MNALCGAGYNSRIEETDNKTNIIPCMADYSSYRGAARSICIKTMKPARGTMREKLCNIQIAGRIRISDLFL